jgi:hypothetical protein
MSASDKLQIFVEKDNQAFEPSETFVDPVSKIRISQPENLIDTDFEYGLQSTKWETLELVKNIPTFYSRTGDTSFSVTSPLCNGQSNGIIVANLTSGNPPFTFTWSPTITQTTQTVTGVGAGTYTVLVLDGTGCSTSSVVNVSEPTALAFTSSPSSTTCFGNSTNLSASASGGTPAYSYTWNPGNLSGSSAIVTPTASTQYTCTVRDLNGCIQTQTVSVTLTPSLSVSANSVAMCLGDSLILVPTITSPGNGGPYTYAWSNGATTPTVMVYGSVATSTNYVLTVSDGCTLPSATAVFTVATNPPPVVNIVADYLSGNAPLTVNFADLGSGRTTVNWNSGSKPRPVAWTFVN